jgi:ribosomal protein L29
MKFKELAQLSHTERNSKRKELELELIKLNTQVATGTPPKNAGTVSRIKKDIAKLLLIEKLSEKKPVNAAPKAAAKAGARKPATK